MTWWWTAPLTVLFLVIFCDMAAAMLAARRCFKKRKEARLAWSIMLLLVTLAAEAANQMVNGVIHLQEVDLPTPYMIQWTIGRAVKAFGTWWLALKLLED